MSAFLRRASAAAGLAGLAPAAQAHGSVAGLGNFFGGALHPLLEPTHAIALIALGLLIGQRGLPDTRPALPVFVAAALAGVAAAGSGFAADLGVALLAAAALGGVALATALPLPRALVAALAGFIALGIGLGSDPEGVSGSARWTALAGTAAGMCVWMLNVAAWTQLLRRPWQRFGVRIAGSWIGAAALLVLALTLTQRSADTNQLRAVDLGAAHVARSAGE